MGGKSTLQYPLLPFSPPLDAQITDHTGGWALHCLSANQKVALQAGDKERSTLTGCQPCLSLAPEEAEVHSHTLPFLLRKRCDSVLLCEALFGNASKYLQTELVREGSKVFAVTDKSKGK